MHVAETQRISLYNPALVRVRKEKGKKQMNK